MNKLGRTIIQMLFLLDFDKIWASEQLNILFIKLHLKPSRVSDEIAENERWLSSSQTLI
jgi:hypothetical protein